MTENKTLATVNGKTITQKDVDAVLQRMDPQRAAQFRSEEGQKRILDNLITQQLILAEAIDNGMDKEKGFQDELEQVKQEILVQYAINKLMDNVEVQPNEVKDYYEQNKDQFIQPEKVKASHILLKDEVTANRVLNEINEGMSFEEAASTYSQCPSKENGGDLGYFTRGKMVQEFEEAAFAMELGEISKPVKTQFGYHIIKLVDRKQPEPSTFDEVKEQLTQYLKSVKQNQVYMDKSQELKGKYQVEIPS